MARSLSLSTAAKLAKLRAMVGVLPPNERPAWDLAIAHAIAPTTVAGDDSEGHPLLKNVKVIRPGEPGYAEAVAAEAERKRLAAAPDVEWDLALANWLDRAYNTASDRVAEVATAAKDAVKREADELFSGAMPKVGLVIAGAGVGALLLYKLSR